MVIFSIKKRVYDKVNQEVCAVRMYTHMGIILPRHVAFKYNIEGDAPVQ